MMIGIAQSTSILGKNKQNPMEMKSLFGEKTYVLKQQDQIMKHKNGFLSFTESLLICPAHTWTDFRLALSFLLLSL